MWYATFSFFSQYDLTRVISSHPYDIKFSGHIYMTRGLPFDHVRCQVKTTIKKYTFFIQNHNSIPLYVATVKPLCYLTSMGRSPRRPCHRVTEDRRIRILTLREGGRTIPHIAKQTKIKQRTVEAVLHKWKL